MKTQLIGWFMLLALWAGAEAWRSGIIGASLPLAPVSKSCETIARTKKLHKARTADSLVQDTLFKKIRVHFKPNGQYHDRIEFWQEGIITASMLQDGIQQFETVENATVTINSDYTGAIRKIRTFNNFPIDTTLERFEYSFVPEAHLLDIVIENTGTPQNPGNANYSQVYDVLNLDDKLEVLHERRSADINGALSEFSIRWQLDRQTSNQLEADYKQILLDPINWEPSGKWEEYWVFSR